MFLVTNVVAFGMYTIITCIGLVTARSTYERGVVALAIVPWILWFQEVVVLLTR